MSILLPIQHLHEARIYNLYLSREQELIRKYITGAEWPFRAEDCRWAIRFECQLTGIWETCIIAQRRSLKPTRSIRPVNYKQINHKWVTTHTNKWMIPISQACSSCDLTRTVDVEAAEKDSHYRWRYSDGTLSDQLPLGGLWPVNGCPPYLSESPQCAVSRSK